MVFHVCLSVCPCRCCGQQSGLRAEPIPSGVKRSFTCSTVDTSAPWGRTLDGGDIRPLGIKVPRVTPRKKAGRPMGPSTPRCSFSKLFACCIVFVVADQVLFWVCYTACSLGISWYGYFSPSRLGPCLPRCGALASFLSPSLSLFFVLFGGLG